MPDSSQPADEPEIRPEVSEALYRALADADHGKIAQLEAAGITPAERKHAEFLLLAWAIDARQEREAEVWDVLIAREWASVPTWGELFDDLTPERAARLGELYDALPEGARQEYDRRYGYPEKL